MICHPCKARTIGHDLPIEIITFFEIHFFPTHDWYRNFSCFCPYRVPFGVFRSLFVALVVNNWFLYLPTYGCLILLKYLVLLGLAHTFSVINQSLEFYFYRKRPDCRSTEMLLINHFYNYLNHYKPFAKLSLLKRSDRPLDIALNWIFYKEVFEELSEKFSLLFF